MGIAEACIAGATVSAASAWKAQKAQHEAQSNAFNMLANMYGSPTNGAYRSLSVSEAVIHPSACENCGSSDYRKHHGRLICSYCRSAP